LGREQRDSSRSEIGTAYVVSLTEMTVLRWPADELLNELIRRYYRGEAALWAAIQAHVDAELRRRNVAGRGFHMRLLRRADGGYDVLVEPADAYVREP
jgi:hypothetical protein